RAFMWPLAAGVAVVMALAALGVRHFYALISFLLCTFVLVTVAIEFYKGANAIRAKSGSSLLGSMVELTHRNTRRYGGYLVHVGIVILFVGFTGKAFDKDKTVEISRGQTVTVGNYALTATNLESGQNENYRWSVLTLDVAKNGARIGQIKPEQRLYAASRQQTSEVAIRRRLDEDLYVNFAGTNGPDKMVIQTYVFPLVSWIWI